MYYAQQPVMFSPLHTRVGQAAAALPPEIQKWVNELRASAQANFDASQTGQTNSIKRYREIQAEADAIQPASFIVSVQGPDSAYVLDRYGPPGPVQGVFGITLGSTDVPAGAQIMGPDQLEQYNLSFPPLRAAKTDEYYRAMREEITRSFQARDRKNQLTGIANTVRKKAEDLFKAYQEQTALADRLVKDAQEAAVKTAERMTRESAVLNAQINLRTLGYYQGAANGVPSPQLDQAIRAFKGDADLRGEPNYAQVDAAIDAATQADLGRAIVTFQTSAGTKAAVGNHVVVDLRALPVTNPAYALQGPPYNARHAVFSVARNLGIGVPTVTGNLESLLSETLTPVATQASAREIEIPKRAVVQDLGEVIPSSMQPAAATSVPMAPTPATTEFPIGAPLPTSEFPVGHAAPAPAPNYLVPAIVVGVALLAGAYLVTQQRSGRARPSARSARRARR